MNLSSSFQRMSGFVLENPKIVKKVNRISNYNDEPQLYQYSSQFVDGNSLKASADSIASGTSFERNGALLKLLGETVERYSLSTYDKKIFIHSSFNKLVTSSEHALNPSKLSLFPQLLEKDKGKISDVQFTWIMGKSLITNRSILVPAQLVFTPYSYSKSEPILRMQISTGAAAGETIYDAIYRGICEVIERDSFMIHYYNKIHSSRIDLQSLGNKKISKIVATFKRYNLELCVNDITTDVGVPAVVATVVDRTGQGPAVCVGLKAGFEMNQNVIGAVEESLMVRSWIRDEYMYSKSKHNLPKIIHTVSKHNLPKIIHTVEERANFWCPLNTIAYLDFWINAKIGRGFYKLNKFNKSTYKEKVIELVRLLGLKGCEVVCVDITASKVRKYGVKVVKVIIPQLQPLHLDEKYSYLDFPRLYNAPVNMGVLKRPLTFKELNHIPHPFL